MARLALISTPRSGNTWLRRLLSGALEAPELAVHTPSDVPWNDLPEDIVLQLHWRREATFVDRLRRADMRVVSIARHPLDVLLSVLRFARHEPETAKWLAGENGDERAILDATPTSEAFLAYATGPRAASLLAVSAEWWSADEVVRVRYEDLVGDTATALAGLDLPMRKPLNEVIATRSSPADLPQHHVATPLPGTWRELLPVRHALAIGDAHRAVFEKLGYRSEPDMPLEPSAAAARWAQIVSA